MPGKRSASWQLVAVVKGQKRRGKNGKCFFFIIMLLCIYIKTLIYLALRPSMSRTATTKLAKGDTLKPFHNLQILQFGRCAISLKRPFRILCQGL